MRTLRKLAVLMVSVFAVLYLAGTAHAAAPAWEAGTMTVNKSSTYLLDGLVYTVTLHNTGDADALDVVLTDVLPPGQDISLFHINDVPQLLSLLTTGVYIGTIPAGQTVTVKIGTIVNNIPQYPAIAQFSNTATWRYRYRSAPGAPLTNASFTSNAAITNMVRLDPSMATATVHLLPILGLGDEVTFTLTIPNTGTLDSSGTTLLNLIPVGALYRAGSTTLNGVTLPDIGIAGPYVLGGLVNSPGAPAGVIRAGQAAVVSFKVTTLLPLIVNASVIDQDGPGPALFLNYQAASIVETTDLALTMTDSVTTVSAGTETTYVISVRNNGPTAVTSVNVWDPLPVTLTNPVYTPSSGTYNSLTGDWTGLSLGVGQTVTLSIKAKVSPLAFGSIANTATVNPPVGFVDSNTANNSATDTNTVSSVADLGISQTNGATSLVPGAAVSYAITVVNNGPGSVASLTVTDVVPLQLQSPVFTPDQGTYTPLTGAWTGLNLQPGESVVLTLSGTVSPLGTGTMVNTATVAPTLGTVDLVTANNTSVESDPIVGGGVAGALYLDSNHNGIRDSNESGPNISGLSAKIISSLGGNALQAAPIDASTGAYQFTGIFVGTYTVIIDNNALLTDTTPFLPPGYMPTEGTTLSKTNIVVLAVGTPNQNFGLWNGGKLTGQVWNDNGTGGGTPNDLTKNGGEVGISGVTVKAANGATTYDTTTTDGSGNYTLWVPAGAVQVVQTVPAGYVALGGKVGSTVGTYARATNSVTFTAAGGTSYTDVDFADAPVNTFTGNSTQTGVKGGAAFFPHLFTAGTAGQVSFAVLANPSPNVPGYAPIIYRDSNNNGTLDATDTPETGSVSLTAGQSVLIFVKVTVPPSAPNNSQALLTTTATFNYNTVIPAMQTSHTGSDTLLVGSQSSLLLTQVVDKTQAKTGETIVYTITYRNNSSETLNGVVIRNSVPAYTGFTSAAFNPLPASLTGCVITKPSVGAAGPIVWTFSGSLSPGSIGTVTFTVQIK